MPPRSADGSRGIGAAIVQRFAAEEAAVTFTYAGSREAAERVASETGATAAVKDSTDRDAVIARVGDSGPLDVLVVNAGVAMMGDALDLDADEVDRMIRIDVQAPYHAAVVVAARQMPQGGRIIVIGSNVGDHTRFSGIAAYTMTKAAVQDLVRELARDFGLCGITVNAVQPGPVDTDMNRANGPLKDTLYGLMALRRHR